MLAEERRKRIRQYVDDHGAATVPELSALLNVSPMTVRRDIMALAEKGLLIRTYGGAISAKGDAIVEPIYNVKKKANLAEKRKIGAEAAKLVNDGETVILDSGSTTFEIAKNLVSRRGLTVITNDLVIALETAKHPAISTLLLGGIVRPNIFSTFGTYTEEMLRQFSVDKAFLSADAVCVDRGILNSNPEEVPVKRLIAQSARETILVVDHTKFSRRGLAFVCDLESVDMVITDSGVPPEVVTKLEEQGVNVRVF